MFLRIVQPELSHTLRKEVDPFSWMEIVGNIGGTWGEYHITTMSVLSYFTVQVCGKNKMEIIGVITPC